MLESYIYNYEKIVSGLMGVCVGDALGVPVEFTSRENRTQNKDARSELCHPVGFFGLKSNYEPRFFKIL